MSRIRVLALCGFTQNAHIYSKQLGAIRKTCKDVDFGASIPSHLHLVPAHNLPCPVFLEPPHIVEKVDMPWNQNTDEFNSDATTEKEEQTAETIPRAWWLSTQDRTVYRSKASSTVSEVELRGVEYDETVRYLHDFLVKEPPFDGIMGFSQGACMAAILAALLEKPGLHPEFPSEPPLQKFKFVISVGGFLPSTQALPLDTWFPLPASLPTLHVVGRNDTVVTSERSQSLIVKCENARVEYHDGGHFTPSKASWRHFVNAYISSFAEGGRQGDVPPPSSFGPSGTSTPIDSKGGGGTPRDRSPAPRM